MKSKRVLIDTNLLVRYLTEDDPKKAEAVEAIIEMATRGELKILIPSIVIAELIWVLESYYEMNETEIAELIDAILNTRGLEITERSIVSSALKTYRIKKIDIVDAWIIELGKARKITTIYTYDVKHFKDIEGIEAMVPGA